MGELKIKIPDEIEQAFRKIAMKRFGYQKGAISYAAKEAFLSWTSGEEQTEKSEDVWDSLEGIMKHVKKSSVTLQHEAWNHVAYTAVKKRGKNAYRR